MGAEVRVCAGGVASSTPPAQGGAGGAGPTPALSPKDLIVAPIPHRVAAQVARDRHYLHSPAATVRLSLGIFGEGQLLGIAVFNPGARHLCRLLQGATQADVLHLARFWLDDRAPRNGESRSLAIIARYIARHTQVKALFAYSDPAAGHRGTIYAAAGWDFLGESGAEALLRIGGGPLRHSRSVSSVLHSHGVGFLRVNGIPVEVVRTPPKLRYVKVLDPAWRARLLVAPRPYPGGGSS